MFRIVKNSAQTLLQQQATKACFRQQQQPVILNDKCFGNSNNLFYFQQFCESRCFENKLAFTWAKVKCAQMYLIKQFTIVTHDTCDQIGRFASSLLLIFYQKQSKYLSTFYAILKNTTLKWPLFGQLLETFGLHFILTSGNTALER